MKTKMIRVIAFLLMSVFVLSAFAGCQNNKGTTNPQATTPPAETEPKDETPKGPIDLNGCRVIIPNGTTKTVEGLVANELKAMLSELDISVRVKEDDGSTTYDEPVILLGKTAATAEEMPAGGKYLIKESNGNLQISAGDYYGYTAALKILKTKIKSSNGLPVGLEQTGSARVANVAKEDESTVRVMFYNIFGWNNWPKALRDKNGNFVDNNGNIVTSNTSIVKPSQTPALAPPEALRMALQIDMLGTFAPDVIGFMEYMSTEVWTNTSIANFHGNMTPMVEALGYTKVDAGGPDGEERYNTQPMFYNANKLEVLDCGFTLYRSTNDEWKSKGVTWAVFREKASGKLFSVFNTHFAHADGKVGDDAREDNAKEFLEIKAAVLAMKSEYNNIPVILGGDLNFWNIWGNYDNQTGDKANDRISETKPYKTLMSGGMLYAANISGVETNGKSGASNYTNSYQGYYEYNTNKKIYDADKTTLITEYTLDYAFVDNRTLSKLDVQKFIVIRDEATLRASDHRPVFIDFALK